jgi:hypothetical protein
MLAKNTLCLGSSYENRRRLQRYQRLTRKVVAQRHTVSTLSNAFTGRVAFIGPGKRRTAVMNTSHGFLALTTVTAGRTTASDNG